MNKYGSSTLMNVGINLVIFFPSRQYERKNPSKDHENNDYFYLGKGNNFQPINLISCRVQPMYIGTVAICITHVQYIRHGLL